MPPRFTGHISTERTVWCGRGLNNDVPKGPGHCEQHLQVSTAEYSRHRGHGAPAYFRSRGWRRTKRDGWTCPRCLRALQLQKTSATQQPLLPEGSTS